MPTPQILLISRRTLERNSEALIQQLSGINVQMAVAVAPEDAVAAQKLTEAVAKFQHVTAIVADFEADMFINDDGSTSLIGYTPIISEEPQIITGV